MGAAKRPRDECDRAISNRGRTLGGGGGGVDPAAGLRAGMERLGRGVDGMKLLGIGGVIRRRILVNYRVAPELIQPLLPPKFRPKLHAGSAIAGICLIRLEQLRPRGMPGFLGTSSENAAHRVAVVWEDERGQRQEGVYIPRRDTDSRLNQIAG